MSNSPLSQHRTFKLDQITTTRLDWSILFLKELGISSPAQRVVLTRAMDFYCEFLEELCSTYSFNPKAKEIRDELYELMKLNKERQSAWNSLEMPQINLDSFGAFPKHSQLSRQYIQPIKTQLPKVRKRKNTEASFAYHSKKYQPTQP